MCGATASGQCRRAPRRTTDRPAGARSRQRLTASAAGRSPASRHVELAVGAGEVHLHGPAGEEERFGDLAVAQAVGGHRRDAALLGRERVDAAAGGASRARSGGSQLVHRPVGLDHRPAPVREVEAIAERLAGIAAMPAAPQRGAEVDQRPRVRQAELGAGEDVRRLARQLDHVAARGEQRAHPEGLADRLGSAEAPGDLELLVDELARSIALPEAGRGERRVAAPHQGHRIHVGERRAPGGRPPRGRCMAALGSPEPQGEPAAGGQRLADAQRQRQLTGRPRRRA